MNTLAILAVTALVAILLAALLLRPTQTQTITITISSPLSEEEERKKRALAYAQRHGNFHAHWGGAAGRPPY